MRLHPAASFCPLLAKRKDFSSKLSPWNPTVGNWPALAHDIDHARSLETSRWIAVFTSWWVGAHSLIRTGGPNTCKQVAAFFFMASWGSITQGNLMSSTLEKHETWKAKSKRVLEKIPPIQPKGHHQKPVWKIQTKRCIQHHDRIQLHPCER